jgi:hypothetical protein
MVLVLSAFAGRTDDLTVSLKNCLSEAFHSRDGGEATIQAILSAYGLADLQDKDDLSKSISLVNFLSDVGFVQPARAYAEAWSAHPGNKAYLCHANSPNPWDGLYKGFATHALDAVFMMQTYNEYLSPAQKECAERMGKDMISFVNGVEPFPPMTGGGQEAQEMLYFAAEGAERDASQALTTAESLSLGRRKILQDIVAGDPTVWDLMTDAMMTLMQGPK